MCMFCLLHYIQVMMHNTQGQAIDLQSTTCAASMLQIIPWRVCETGALDTFTAHTLQATGLRASSECRGFQPAKVCAVGQYNKCITCLTLPLMTQHAHVVTCILLPESCCKPKTGVATTVWVTHTVTDNQTGMLQTWNTRDLSSGFTLSQSIPSVEGASPETLRSLRLVSPPSFALAVSVALVGDERLNAVCMQAR